MKQQKFKIEGWFPPAIFKSSITNERFAICGSNWVRISEEITMEEVLKGWICSAPQIIIANIPKKLTKKQLTEKLKLK